MLKIAKFDPKVVSEFRETSAEFARRGYRSLAVAIKEEGKEWQLLGIMSMQDPPRPDSAAVSNVWSCVHLILKSSVTDNSRGTGARHTYQDVDRRRWSVVLHLERSIKV